MSCTSIAGRAIAPSIGVRMPRDPCPNLGGGRIVDVPHGKVEFEHPIRFMRLQCISATNSDTHIVGPQKVFVVDHSSGVPPSAHSAMRATLEQFVERARHRAEITLEHAARRLHSPATREGQTRAAAAWRAGTSFYVDRGRCGESDCLSNVEAQRACAVSSRAAMPATGLGAMAVVSPRSLDVWVGVLVALRRLLLERMAE